LYRYSQKALLSDDETPAKGDRPLGGSFGASQSVCWRSLTLIWWKVCIGLWKGDKIGNGEVRSLVGKLSQKLIARNYSLSTL
jgi:hypothetical protein